MRLVAFEQLNCQVAVLPVSLLQTHTHIHTLLGDTCAQVTCQSESRTLVWFHERHLTEPVLFLDRLWFYFLLRFLQQLMSAVRVGTSRFRFKSRELKLNLTFWTLRCFSHSQKWSTSLFDSHFTIIKIQTAPSAGTCRLGQNLISLIWDS